MRKKIYISIPMSGLDLDMQRDLSIEIATSLSHFYDVVSPFDNGVPADAHPSQHMRADFKMLLDCDAIFMCKGWEDSAGCRAEWTVATACHMTVIYQDAKSNYFK